MTNIDLVFFIFMALCCSTGVYILYKKRTSKKVDIPDRFLEENKKKCVVEIHFKDNSTPIQIEISAFKSTLYCGRHSLTYIKSAFDNAKDTARLWKKEGLIFHENKDIPFSSVKYIEYKVIDNEDSN